MAIVTLQILDGVDRGRVFERLATPISIGREEGNTVQLNDERVSRYHAKIQEDQGQLVLTDLESTNGTRVNGEPVPLVILRVGDRVTLGRSVLLIGSSQEIDGLLAGSQTPQPNDQAQRAGDVGADGKTRQASAMTDCYNADSDSSSEELKFQLNYHGDGVSQVPLASTEGSSTAPRQAPGLPTRLSPAQAAQLAELLLYLHQRMAAAVDAAEENAGDGSVRLSRAAWQRILRIEMELARYHYQTGHPE